MPPRVPHRALPTAAGQNPQNLVGISYLPNDSFGFPATPFVLLLGASVVSDPIWAPGFDSFMLITDFAVGNLDFVYLVLDPLSQVSLVTRTIAAAAAPGVVLHTFGASSTNAPVATRGDVWIMFQLRLTAVGFANVTVNSIRLWCGVR
jgi:hypothetical protein